MIDQLKALRNDASHQRIHPLLNSIFKILATRNAAFSALFETTQVSFFLLAYI